jgi:hypothetical protein
MKLRGSSLAVRGIWYTSEVSDKGEEELNLLVCLICEVWELGKGLVAHRRQNAKNVPLGKCCFYCVKYLQCGLWNDFLRRWHRHEDENLDCTSKTLVTAYFTHMRLTPPTLQLRKLSLAAGLNGSHA